MEIMVDLETLSTADNACIISIGAARFDLYGKDLYDSFYVVVDPASCQEYGLHIDASTVMWWMEENKSEARREFLSESKQDLGSALEGFAMWAKEGGIEGVWGNGAAFDNVILRNAYKAAGMECPWPFWRDRCYRTMKSLPGAPEMTSREGTHHNALDDAISQAAHLQQIADALTLRGV